MDGETMPTPEVLDRWLAGEASADDARQAAAWRAADAAHAAWLDALVATVRSAPAGAPGPTATDAAWRALATRLALPAAGRAAAPMTTTGMPAPVRGGPAVRVVDGTRATPAPARSWHRSPLARAVAAGLAVTAAVLVGRAVGTPGASADLAIIVAPAGQRATATLPDGSQVTLAPGSRLTWSRRAYGEAARDLVLHGEGYFVAVHDDARPFRVRAGRALVRDIGTRFAVRALDGGDPEVAVEEGAVALGDTLRAGHGPGTVLRAGQRARLARDGHVAFLGEAAPALAWVAGTLVFDDLPLPEVLATVGRWYGTTIVADPALRDRRITARFDGHSLHTLTTALAVTLQARVVRQGDTTRLLAP